MDRRTVDAAGQQAEADEDDGHDAQHPGRREELLEELDFERQDLQYFYTRQRRQLGLGHAVLCASPLVRGEPFVVALGETFAIGSLACTVGPAAHTVPCLSLSITDGRRTAVIVGDTCVLPPSFSSM